MSWHSARESDEHTQHTRCVQSWNPLLWLQTSGPGGLSQTSDTNPTNNMKNKTHNPYLQWNLSRSLSPSLDNKWSEWYIHQDQINCEIKRTIFK